MREDAIMKRIGVVPAAVGLALLAARRCARTTRPRTKRRPTRRRGSGWLSSTAEKYAESWKQAASVFSKAVTAEQWTAALTAARGPYGSLVSRTLESAEYRRRCRARRTASTS